MPYISGLEVIALLRKTQKLPPSILIPAFGGDDVRPQASEMGVAAVFSKPFEVTHLLAKVREILSGPASAGYRSEV
jgi:DNA-binding response OmpR family regulator